MFFLLLLLSTNVFHGLLVVEPKQENIGQSDVGLIGRLEERGARQAMFRTCGSGDSGDLLGCKFSFEMQTLPLLLWNYVHFNGSSLFWLFVSMPPCQERVTLLIQ